MLHESIWQATSKPAALPLFGGEAEVDVVVIGGGITGITTAMLLAEAGRSVIVLEARQVGTGTTGRSTGNLYAVVGNGLATIAQKWGDDRMKEVVRSRASAVDFVEQTVTRHRIDCDFRRCTFHLYAPGLEDATRRQIERECDAAAMAGLPAHMVEEVPLPFHTGHAMVIEHQANFHPLAYVRGLVRAIASDGCRIFEHSEAGEIDYDHGIVKTARGQVAAKAIVMATHTPKGFDLVQTELGPYREYAIAATLRTGAYPDGIFWSEEPARHSIRSLRRDGREWLIVLGHKHKTGQEKDATACFEALEDFARANFDIESIDCRWSAQGYYPADGLPLIGRSATHDKLYIATGFLADGLTYGTVAARILAGEILGRPEPGADLYKANRVRPMKAAKDFLKENLNVAAEYVKDYASMAKVKGLEEVPVGEGRIVEIDGKRCALYRAESDTAVCVSPVCTHLKCMVHWNNAEKSWDCPCHGSRFAIDGSVIEGPAARPLERIALDEDQSGKRS
ncbi:MAG TPA: FAD-dependent oxidoreductase [Usitatibacter sp.]|nr:FAD-dependent oxidoreductase [Usitatibacter sp.]